MNNSVESGLLTFTGFILFLFGFLAIVVNLIGADLVPFNYIDAHLSGLVAFLIKIIMIIAGIVIVVISRGNFSGEGGQWR